MSEAPERIGLVSNGLGGFALWNREDNKFDPAIEYIRADLFDAVKAERDTLEARVKALTAAEALVAECDIYLKEGETPRQRMDRDHLDVLALMKMLADDRKRRDEAEARVKALTEALEFYAAENTYVTHYEREACDCCTHIFEPINQDKGETARAALQENTDDR